MIVLKRNWRRLLGCILLPLAVGALAAFLTRDGIAVFDALQKPALSPPAWLFPAVWTILYVLMGVASYLVLTAGRSADAVKAALSVYAIGLILNFFWPILFFVLEGYLLSLAWLVALWIAVLATLLAFYHISKPAGLLLAPYLVWVTFAGYLNLAVYLLN